jgi:hypothetical protein
MRQAVQSDCAVLDYNSLSHASREYGGTIHLTIVPGDDGGDYTKGFIVHSTRLVAEGEVRAALLRFQSSFSIVDQPFELAASRNYLSESSINHCEKFMSKCEILGYRRSYILVLPVSRHATLAHTSCSLMSQPRKLRSTRRRSPQELSVHSICARLASSTFPTISASVSAGKVSRWTPVEGS